MSEIAVFSAKVCGNISAAIGADGKKQMSSSSWDDRLHSVLSSLIANETTTMGNTVGS